MNRIAGHRGEHEGSRNTIAQETPDDPALPVVTMLVCFIFSHEAAGAARHPAFPAPSYLEGFCKTILQDSGVLRREIAL